MGDTTADYERDWSRLKRVHGRTLMFPSHIPGYGRGISNYTMEQVREAKAAYIAYREQMSGDPNFDPYGYYKGPDGPTQVSTVRGTTTVGRGEGGEEYKSRQEAKQRQEQFKEKIARDKRRSKASQEVRRLAPSPTDPILQRDVEVRRRAGGDRSKIPDEWRQKVQVRSLFRGKPNPYRSHRTAGIYEYPSDRIPLKIREQRQKELSKAIASQFGKPSTKTTFKTITGNKMLLKAMLGTVNIKERASFVKQVKTQIQTERYAKASVKSQLKAEVKGRMKAEQILRTRLKDPEFLKTIQQTEGRVGIKLGDETYHFQATQKKQPVLVEGYSPNFIEKALFKRESEWKGASIKTRATALAVGAASVPFGLYQLVRHPIQTGKGIWEGITNPMQTGAKLGKLARTQPEYVVGVAAGSYLTGKVAGKTYQTLKKAKTPEPKLISGKKVITKRQQSSTMPELSREFTASKMKFQVGKQQYEVVGEGFTLRHEVKPGKFITKGGTAMKIFPQQGSKDVILAKTKTAGIMSTDGMLRSKTAYKLMFEKGKESKGMVGTLGSYADGKTRILSADVKVKGSTLIPREASVGVATDLGTKGGFQYSSYLSRGFGGTKLLKEFSKAYSQKIRVFKDPTKTTLFRVFRSGKGKPGGSPSFSGLETKSQLKNTLASPTASEQVLIGKRAVSKIAKTQKVRGTTKTTPLFSIAKTGSILNTSIRAVPATKGKTTSKVTPTFGLKTVTRNKQMQKQSNRLSITPTTSQLTQQKVSPFSLVTPFSGTKPAQRIALSPIIIAPTTTPPPPNITVPVTPGTPTVVPGPAIPFLIPDKDRKKKKTKRKKVDRKYQYTPTIVGIDLNISASKPVYNKFGILPFQIRPMVKGRGII